VALLLPATVVLLWVRAAPALAQPALQAAVTASFSPLAVKQERVQASPALPVSLAMLAVSLFLVPPGASSRALHLHAAVPALLQVRGAPVPQAAVTASFSPLVVQQARVPVSRAVPVSLAMLAASLFSVPPGASSWALELHAAVPAFLALPEGLLAQVVPSAPALTSLQVVQVLMVPPLAFLPAAPVSLQAFLARQHFGPFVNENRSYFDWRLFGPHERS
jgi:hypothetical protein